MPKTPTYIVVDVENEAVVATGRDPEGVIKDLQAAIEADPEDSWAETYLLCRCLGPLTIEKRPHITVPSNIKPKPKPNGRKPARAYKTPGKRVACFNPDCRKGFIAHRTQVFHNTKCGKAYHNTIYRCAQMLAANRPIASLVTKVPWLLDTPHYTRMRKLAMGINPKLGMATTHDAKPVTIVKNTPTKG